MAASSIPPEPAGESIQAALPAHTVGAGAAWSLLYVTSVRLGTFGLSVVVARVLGANGAGAFGIAIQAAALVAFIGSWNLPQAVVKLLSEDPTSPRLPTLFRDSFTLLLLGTGTLALLMIVSAPALASKAYHDTSLISVLRWSAPLAMGTAIYLWSEGILQAIRRFRALAIWGVAITVADLIVGFVAAWFGIAALLASRAIVRGLAACAALPLWKPRAATVSADPAIGRMHGLLFRYAGPVFVSSAIVMTGQFAIRMILAGRSGLGETGLFHVADSVAQGLLLVPMAAGVAYFPAVSRDHAARRPLEPSLIRAMTRVLGISVPLCLATIGISPWLVRLIFGDPFASAGPCLIVLSVAYGVAGAGNVLGTILLGRWQVGLAIGVNATWFLVTIGLLAAGGTGIEAVDVANAILLGYGVLLVMELVIASRSWKVSLTPMVPVLGGTTLALGSMAALALYTPLPKEAVLVLSLIVATLVFKVWGWDSLREGLSSSRLRPR